MQLTGLSLYSLYPQMCSVDLFSFVTGFDFSNFAFMFNIPVKYIPVCLECRSFAGFAFVLGDMNWLKIMGSLLLCLFILLVFIVLFYFFNRTKSFSKFLVKLTIDLMMVKCVFAWFGSLIYAGLNFNHNSSGSFNIYTILMHMMSYLLFAPLIYFIVNSMKNDKSMIASKGFLCI